MPRHGENIRKRADGRWEGRYIVNHPEKGKIQQSIYGKTYSEVKRRKNQALGGAVSLMAVSAGQKLIPNGTDILFETVTAEWFEKIKNTRKHATYIKYCYIYETYLLDILEKRLLSDAATDYFQNMLIRRTADCSESIRKSIYSVLSGILSHGVENHHMTPIRLKRKMPSRAKKKLDIYTQREQTILLRYLYENMDVRKMGIILCLSTGLRLGEICSLRWIDIDFQNKVLFVNRTVQRIVVNNQETKTALYVGAPKTSCSQREIPLSDESLLLLSRFKHHGAYVLNDAAPLEPRTYQYQFEKFQRQAGIDCKNFHVLRHTFATNCIGNGVDVKSLSEILGHSNVQITLNRYVHPSLDTKRQYMNHISSVYGQIVGQDIQVSP